MEVLASSKRQMQYDNCVLLTIITISSSFTTDERMSVSSMCSTQLNKINLNQVIKEVKPGEVVAQDVPPEDTTVNELTR